MTHPTIKTLVALRIAARKRLEWRELNSDALQKARSIKANAIATGDRLTEAQAQIWIEEGGQFEVEHKFALIEIGKTLVHVAAECEKLPRGDWLRALNVNESEWFTPAMLEDGDRLHEVVAGLRLENSATADTGSLSRPLACCFQMAMHNAIKTNPKLDKFMHEAADEVFGGAISARFGEWQEPTTLQRLGVNV